MDADDRDPTRDLVLAKFRELGVSESDMDRVTDTLLIRDGHYCGRSFRCGGLLAMWMGGFVQFYGSEGELLQTLLLRPQKTSQQSKAA